MEINGVKIKYINESGREGSAFLSNPSDLHHVWYSSKRNVFGKFERHEVTNLGAFLSKLKNCKKVEVTQL